MANDAPQLFVALLHFPVYNKAREIVATSLTTLNLHDLARLTATYGASGCYVVTPLQRQRELARQIITHWTHGYGHV
jgi:tRNA (guanine37-N1)-methyltransferase